MGRRILVAALLLALGTTAFVDAREWVSRDGQFTVEAELLSVDGDQVVFRKETGAQVLHLASIPKEEIAQSRAMVASGGTAADSGLPPVVAIKTEGALACCPSRAASEHPSWARQF